MVTMSLAINTEGRLMYSYNDYDTDKTQEWLQDPHPRRGDIQITLISPSGTESTLLPYRKNDFVNDNGYNNWPFTTVHYWGENPDGEWSLNVAFKSSSGSITMDNVTVTLYGTSSKINLNIQCDSSCARNCSSAMDPEACDVCSGLRDAFTLACVSVCPINTSEYNNYCISGDIIFPQEEETSQISLIIGISVAGMLLMIAVIIIVIIIVIVIIVCMSRRKRTRRYSGIVSAVDPGEYNDFEFNNKVT